MSKLNNEIKYVQVAFPLTSFKQFTYSIPHALLPEIDIGTCVKAPIRGKERIGYVVNIEDFPNYDGKIFELKGRMEKDLSIPKDLWKASKSFGQRV